MPLVSSDALGGVIVTDWYSDPNTPNERVKITVYINDSVLRSDALNVQMYKSLRSAKGDWVQASCDSKQIRELEDIILTRARNLRIQARG
jgi:hypothetical protein